MSTPGSIIRAKGPGAIGRGGPIGGMIIDKKLKSMGLLVVRLVSLAEGRWCTETLDRETGEPRGKRWITRKDGKYTFSKVPA